MNGTQRIKTKKTVTVIILLSTFLLSGQSWGYLYFYFVSLIMAARIKLKIKPRLFKDYFWLFIIPNICILIHAFCCIIINHETFFISRSINNFVYIIACVIFAYCLFALHGRKSVDIILLSICIYYIYQLFAAFFVAGPETFITNIFKFGSPELSQWLEAHDIGLSLGLIIIFYLYFYDNSKKNKRKKLLWSVIIFILCWKRIALGAIIAVIVFKILYNRKVDKRGRLTLIWGIAGVLICFAYVYCVNNESILGWFWDHGINTMGRSSIYRYFEQFYTLSPSFWGRGSGFTGKMMTLNVGTENNIGNILAIHSDILRAYIEYGFIGSLLWYSYYLIYLPHKTAKKRERFSEVFFVVVVYSFIVYLTDNTSNYMLFQTLFMLIPLCAENDSIFSIN